MRNGLVLECQIVIQTSEFEAALDRLVILANTERPAILCAEAVPWRCHRSLIADALLARGVAVEDIFSDTLRKPHSMTPFPVVHGERVSYPSDVPGQAALL